MSEVAETRTPAAIAAAASNLGRDMLDTLMGHVEKLPGWAMTSEQTRNAAVKALRESVESTVRQAIQIIGSGQFPACGGMLANVSFGSKGIKAIVEIDRKAPGRHELIEMAGLEVVLLMASSGDYLARMQDIKERSAQTDLFPQYKGVPETDGEVRASVAGEPAISLGALCSTFDCGHPYGDHTEVGNDGTTGCTVQDCMCGAFQGTLERHIGEILDADAVTVRDTAEQPASASDESLMKIADVRVVLAGQLAQIDIIVGADLVEKLTDPQARAAYEYAVRLADYPQSALPRPFFLPEPTPRDGA